MLKFILINNLFFCLHKMSRKEEKRDIINLLDLPIDILNLILHQLDFTSQGRFKQINKSFYQDQDLQIRYKLLYDENNKNLKRIQVNELENYKYDDNIFKIKDITFELNNLDDLYIFSINNKKFIIYNNIVVFEYENTYIKYENDFLIKILLLDNIDNLPIFIDYKNNFKLIYNTKVIDTKFNLKFNNLYFIRFSIENLVNYCYCIYLDKNNNNLLIISLYTPSMKFNIDKERFGIGSKELKFQNIYVVMYNLSVMNIKNKKQLSINRDYVMIEQQIKKYFENNN